MRQILSGRSLQHWFTKAGSGKQYPETPNGPHLGKTVKLALTDPDSNEVVPWAAPRFGGAFMLTSQGDKEQIYVQLNMHTGQITPVKLRGASVHPQGMIFVAS